MKQVGWVVRTFVALIVGVSVATAGWAKPTLLRTLDWQEMAQEVRSVSFSADGRFVATVGRDSEIRVWPVDGGPMRRVGQNVEVARFSPDGRWLAGLVDGRITLWDATSLSETGRVLAPESLERFVWNGPTLAAVGASSAFIIDAEAREVVRTIGGAHGFITTDAASKMVSALADHMATVWSVSSGRMRCTVPAGEIPRDSGREPVACTGIAMSPDKRFLLTADAKGLVILASLPEGEVLKRLLVAKDTGTVDVVFSPDSGSFATVPTHGGVTVWDTAFKPRVHIPDSGNVGAFSPDGKILAVGRDRGVRLWKLDP